MTTLVDSTALKGSKRSTRSARSRRATSAGSGSSAAGRIPAQGSREAASSRVPVLARPMTSYYVIASATALLVGLGLLMVLSASSVVAYATSGSSFAIFEKQLLWVVAGVPLMLVASRLPLRTFRRMAYPILLTAVAGMCLVLVPGIGHSAYGATRWIGFGSFNFQPSELAKLGLALWGADLLVRKRRLLREWRHLLIPLLPVAMLVAGLIMLEPDLGTTIVTLTVVLALLWTIGSPLRMFGGLLGLTAALGTFLAVQEPYRLQRLTSFANPFHDAQDTGYQAVQGLYALASGGWWGLGLGASRQKWSYLPNAHTDFIMAIIGEELGLVGTLFVVALFCVLAYGGIRVAQRSADPFGRLLAAAITAWLVGQALINMGAVAGLLPITGIPLPLISFGGSSLLPTMFAIGILLSLARSEPAAAHVLAARAARRSARRQAARQAKAAGKAAVTAAKAGSAPDKGQGKGKGPDKGKGRWRRGRRKTEQR